jgi:nitrite reductase/ring-hydroxylating ferredoxin subunit
MLLGHVGGEPALLVRRGADLFAVGATCTHYGAPLSEGLVVGDTVRCPWHHACFSLRTGTALRPPALNSLTRWAGRAARWHGFVREPQPAADMPPAPVARDLPSSVVIIGGGGAGNTAAETLRRAGYAGTITLLSAEASPPCDRPNLSKDYLAGTAEADWIPLRSQEFYSEHAIDLKLGVRVAAIEPDAHALVMADGQRLSYGALLLTTGAEPIRLEVPGAALPHVHVLRTLADCDALIARVATVRHCVVIGASFIGPGSRSFSADPGAAGRRCCA